MLEADFWSPIRYLNDRSHKRGRLTVLNPVNGCGFVSATGDLLHILEQRWLGSGIHSDVHNPMYFSSGFLCFMRTYIRVVIHFACGLLRF